MKSAPCAACDKRYVGCHADCEQYNSWKVKALEMAEKRRNERRTESMIDGFISNAKLKMTRKAKKET